MKWLVLSFILFMLTVWYPRKSDQEDMKGERVGYVALSLLVLAMTGLYVMDYFPFMAELLAKWMNTIM